MQLILHRNGDPVEHPPIYAGRSFYYSAGKIGTSGAAEGWTHTQTVYEDPGEPQFDEDGEIIEQEPVVREIVYWSLVAAPPPPEPEPPTLDEIHASMPQLSPVQFRFLLLGIGFSGDDVNAAIAGISDPTEREKASIYWEYATYFERINPLIDGVGSALGLTPEQIDTAWMAFVGDGGAHG